MNIPAVLNRTFIAVIDAIARPVFWLIHRRP